MTVSILRLPQVKTRTGVSRSGMYAAIKGGNFPAPVALGPRAVGWLESDITAWIQSRPRAGFVADAAARMGTVATQVTKRKKAPAAQPSGNPDGQPVAQLPRVRGIAAPTR